MKSDQCPSPQSTSQKPKSRKQNYLLLYEVSDDKFLGHIQLKQMSNSNANNASQVESTKNCPETKIKQSRLKTTALSNLLPMVASPNPKGRRENRHQGRSRTDKSFFQQKEKQKSENGSRMKEDNNEKIEEKGVGQCKKKQKEKRVSSFANNIGYDFCGRNEDEKRRISDIIDILAYIHGEFENKSKVEYTLGKIYETWEALEILEYNKDTNLGDFIIKLPNPDCLPDQLNQTAATLQSIGLTQALQFYHNLFNTEQVTDKKRQNKEQAAYIVAFYLLDVKGNLRSTDFQTNKPLVEQFYQQFSYYSLINEKTVEAYLQMKKQESFLIKENKLNKFFKEARVQMNNALSKHKAEEFLNYKRKIFYRLFQKLEYEFQKADREKKIIHKPFIASVLLCSQNYSELFRHFPKFLKDIYEEAIAEKDTIFRKLFYGGGLEKINKGGHLYWSLNSKRPRDLSTLLRRFLMYKLTRVGGIFTRTFISSDEHYIFLVVKASEQHLERQAQNSNYEMELQFGATDLFAFEPVDRYFRPLRINKYIRDLEFYKKYNLGVNKEDKDENIGEKSMQSESRNIYKKACEMNNDELRAKIILDQEECDEMYRWASKLLSVTFIKGDENLINKYNTEQVDEDIWPAYFVFNKMIIQGMHRIRQVVNSKHQTSEVTKIFKKNIGLLLRLLFLKSLNVANDLYFHHRKSLCRSFENLYKGDMILKNLWNRLGENYPRGYWPYFYSEKLERMWRKYQISEQKQRSKFTPAARTIIVDRIILSQLSISQAKMQGLIIDYYPIHDPYILKSIQIQPYLNVLDNLVSQKEILAEEGDDFSQNTMKSMFVQYECEYTSEDFTKDSVYEKLRFQFRKINQFSVNTVAFYCGEKLAFYFQFRRFTIKKAFPFILPTFIFQILLWVEKTHVTEKGSSDLTPFNSALMIIMAIINMIWVDNTIHKWKAREESLARAFGTKEIHEKYQKRVLFDGSYYRNIQTDEMNYQKVGNAHNIIKGIITLALNSAYIVLMGATLLMIFVLKGILYQEGYSQSLVTVGPAILISLTVQVYNFIYSKLIRLIVNFQNHRTINSYQSSLSSKNFVITFIVTYFCLFIYAFFSTYLSESNVCLVKTDQGAEINDCYFYVSSQLITSAIIDLLLTIVFAFLPYLMFRYNTYKTNKNKKGGVHFNGNYFQSFDQFYQEQDRMSSFMYSDEIDNTWIQFTTAVIMFTTLALFGPIVPFLYPMIYITGLVSLHSKKFQIIFFSKRTIPAKVNSIGSSWLRILQIVSLIGVFSNTALIIYVRSAFDMENQSTVFLSICFVVIILKYLISMIPNKQDLVGQRSKEKAQNFVQERGILSFDANRKFINTDIENVHYNESELHRKLPKLHHAYIKAKK